MDLYGLKITSKSEYYTREYGQAANDTIRRENKIESEPKVLPKKQVVSRLIFNLKSLQRLNECKQLEQRF
jgi:hypothetical protein